MTDPMTPTRPSDPAVNEDAETLKRSRPTAWNKVGWEATVDSALEYERRASCEHDVDVDRLADALHLAQSKRRLVGTMADWAAAIADEHGRLTPSKKGGRS